MIASKTAITCKIASVFSQLPHRQAGRQARWIRYHLKAGGGQGDQARSRYHLQAGGPGEEQVPPTGRGPGEEQVPPTGRGPGEDQV